MGIPGYLVPRIKYNEYMIMIFSLIICAFSYKSVCICLSLSLSLPYLPSSTTAAAAPAAGGL